MSKTKKENLKEYENLKAENIEFYKNEQNLNLYNFQDSKTKLKKDTIDSTSTTDSLKVNLPNNIFEKIFPNNSRMWKIETFNTIYHSFNYLLPTNIICIGDSFIEIEACKNLGKKFNNCFVKTIKFKECPNIEELSMQIFLVIDKFSYIFDAEKNWTIKVEKKIPCKKIR